MKYANGFTCLCTVLACSGVVMAQGNGFGFAGGAPSLKWDVPSHSLSILVMDVGTGSMITDADVTALAANGALKDAVSASDGTYFVDSGIGHHTMVNVGTRDGMYSVNVALPNWPLVNGIQIRVSGTQAKAVVVDRANIFTGVAVSPFAAVGAASGGGIAGGCPSCCSATGVPGCEDPECEALVCGIDPFCCDVAWDGICAGEANDLCECCAAPPPPGGCDCCVAHPGVGCGDPDCEAAVCAIDPFCCDVEWDGICAGEAQDICAKLCNSPECSGGKSCPTCCTATGVPGCENAECEAAVCAIDPFCCDVAWDGICAGEAADLCPCCSGPPPPCCPLGCPKDAEPEGEEPCGADTNGGCNSVPAVFSDGCNGVHCGTAWADGGTRDTDWYLVQSDGGTISGTVVSQIPTVCFIVSGIPACAPAVEGAIGCSSNCVNTAVASADLPPGTYVVFVATGDCGGGGIFEGFPCPDCNTYTLEISGDDQSCGGPPPPVFGACCCAPDCVIVTEEECAALDGVYLGDNTECTLSAGYSFGTCGNPFVNIVGAGGILAPIASSSDDAGDAGIPIGFTFNFYGDDHATIGIASNGFLSFAGDLGTFVNAPIPSGSTPNDMIAPYWDDWNPGAGGDVYYRTDGPVGTRRFIAQWNAVLHFGGTGPATFEAILFETSNCIEFRYGTPLVPNSPTIGVENQGGTDGEPGGFGPPASSGSCFVVCPIPAGDPCEGQCPEGFNVDIKPGVCPNPFHLTSNPAAFLTVAIVGKDGEDLPDPADITIAGVSPLNSSFGDVSTAGGAGNCECGANGGDGVTDLVLNFQRTALQAALGLDAGDIGDEVVITVDENGEAGGSDCVVVE